MGFTTSIVLEAIFEASTLQGGARSVRTVVGMDAARECAAVLRLDILCAHPCDLASNAVVAPQSN